ncbi:hypothetical protein L195_g051538, partial [Trifolium pratense]
SVKNGASKESNVNGAGREDNEVMKVKPSSNYSFDEAESLTDSLEAESQAIAESTEGCQSSPETWIQASPRSRKDSYC